MNVDGRRRTALRALGVIVGACAVASSGAFALASCREPPPPDDHTPEGAYALVALAVEEGRDRDVFPYLEDEAQWASYTIRRERLDALSRAKESYPPDALADLERAWRADADAPDGADVFVRIGRVRGWFARLRKDLSGVARVETDGDRATIVTARGTRYPMRRRTVGIWGLTMFSAELTADAEHATRDRLRVQEAARDYDLAKGDLTKGDGAKGKADAAVE